MHVVLLLDRRAGDVQQAFEEKKNKLGVVKAWSAAAEAKCQQAHFVCLAHNLMLMLERLIGASENIRDEKVEVKRAARQALAERVITAAGRRLNPLVTGCARATERSLQFIRWLRYCLGKPRLWSLEIEALCPYMKAYIILKPHTVLRFQRGQECPRSHAPHETHASTRAHQPMTKPSSGKLVLQPDYP